MPVSVRRGSFALLAPIALAGAPLLACARGHGGGSTTGATAWMSDPRTVAIPDHALSGEIAGSALTLRNITFFTSSGPAWDLRVEGTDGDGHLVVVNAKIAEPLASGRVHVADRDPATRTQLDVADRATKKNDSQTRLASVLRLELTTWEVKPYDGTFQVRAGRASGRLHLGFQAQDGRASGVAGTFTAAAVSYSGKPPG